MKKAPRIALATATELPLPDRESPEVVAALAALGVEAVIVPWSEPFDWGSLSLVVIRSTWDYHRRLDAFLAWAERVARATRLANPLSVVRWNARKSYLLDLERRGVSIVPTVLLPRADGGEAALAGVLAGLPLAGLPIAWRDGALVAKPLVGAGGHGAVRGRLADPAFARSVLALRRAGDALLQPFAASVEAEGELSLVYLNGSYSHAVKKLPAQGDFRVQETYGGTLHDHEPSADERATAEAALAAAPARTLYARVDLVRVEGRPAVMELELLEPDLFLARRPGATAGFAEALRAEALRRALDAPAT